MSEPLNTHGLKPNPNPQFKLFDVDGFQLLMGLDSNNDGEGYGIRYTVAFDIEGLAPVSVWIGVNRGDGEDISDEACAAWDGIFADADQDSARKALQVVLNQVAPALVAGLSQ